MKLIKIYGDTGVVESGGIRRDAKISFIKDPRIGDYVLVHAGFAMEKVKPKEARKTLKILKEMR
jgi:hydrogenase expression/formation protein HypC